MTAAVEAGEATRRELAYLTDRVLLHEGEQQVYGTQMTARGGKWVPFELPAPGEQVTITCPRCGETTTATFKG